MPRRPLKLLHPTAVLTVLVLAAGVVQAAPATAAPSPAPVATPPVTSLTAKAQAAFAPSDEGRGTGESPSNPARLESTSMSSVVLFTNTGTEGLTHLSTTMRVVANGHVQLGPFCTLALPVDDGPPPPATGRTSNRALTPQTLSSFVLEPGEAISCSIVITQVWAGTLHDDVSTATGTGVDTGTVVSVEDHVYARSDVPKPPPWELPPFYGMGDLVWLDTNADGRQDLGEPGIEGVRLSLLGPHGVPVPGADDGGDGPQTTDGDGFYYFTHLPDFEVFPAPDQYFTVVVDPSSPGLEGLMPTLAGVGDDDRRDSSTGSARAPDNQVYDNGLDFGYVPKPPVVVTVDDTATTVVTGSELTVSGRMERKGEPLAGAAVLQFRAAGTSSWRTVAEVTTTTGALSTRVTPTGTGSYRYRFAGDSRTLGGVSPEEHVVVRHATVDLTVAAPSRVRVGSAVTVSGTITREGVALEASTVLESSPDGRRWTRVADVRSTAEGALAATLTPRRTALYRYRFAGDATTDPATSPARQVSVRLASVRLTVSAPHAVTKGRSIKVRGSIRREGERFRATTFLELSNDGGDSWSTVKTVRTRGKGVLSASVRPARTGQYRYRFAGNSTTDAGVSRSAAVVVAPKRHR